MVLETIQKQYMKKIKNNNKKNKKTSIKCKFIFKHIAYLFNINT